MMRIAGRCWRSSSHSARHCLLLVGVLLVGRRLQKQSQLVLLTTNNNHYDSSIIITNILLDDILGGNVSHKTTTRVEHALVDDVDYESTTSEAALSLNETIQRALQRAARTGGDIFSVSHVKQLRPLVYTSIGAKNDKNPNVLCDWAAAQQQQQRRAMAPDNSTSFSTAETSWSSSSYNMVHITFGCHHAFEKAYAGTGNILLALYKLRANAQHLGWDVALTCPDAVPQQTQLVLPWLMGWFPANTDTNYAHDAHATVKAPAGDDSTATNTTTTTIQQCFQQSSVNHMLPSIQYDLQRMAVAMAGYPRWWKTKKQSYSNNNYHYNYNNPVPGSIMQVESPPAAAKPLLLNNMLDREDLDDVAIHFRCGDLIRRDHAGFGFLKFRAYVAHISESATSIGIITQPFSSSVVPLSSNNTNNSTGPQPQQQQQQVRKIDFQNGKGERCRLIVTALQQYLQERFPHATVRIHNDADETVVQSYVRLIHAQQTFAGISSFGTFAALATFGTAYIVPALSNRWLLQDPPPRMDQLANHVVWLQNENDIISSGNLKALWNATTEDGSRVIEWFVRD